MVLILAVVDLMKHTKYGNKKVPFTERHCIVYLIRRRNTVLDDGRRMTHAFHPYIQTTIEFKIKITFQRSVHFHFEGKQSRSLIFIEQ